MHFFRIIATSAHVLLTSPPLAAWRCGVPVLQEPDLLYPAGSHYYDGPYNFVFTFHADTQPAATSMMLDFQARRRLYLLRAPTERWARD